MEMITSRVVQVDGEDKDEVDVPNPSDVKEKGVPQQKDPMTRELAEWFVGT
jgi:hypothetical protein